MQPATPIADQVAGYDMLYSSGTTGRPKGIKRESENNPIELPNPFLRMLCAGMCGMNSDSIYLSPAPLYHAAPLRFNMMAIMLGGTSVIMEFFDAEEFLKLVEKYRVTQSQLVPTMFVRMLKLPEEVRRRYDVSSLKGAIHAAAPCPIDVKAKMIEWWGPILIDRSMTSCRPSGIWSPFLAILLSVISGRGNRLPSQEMLKATIEFIHV